MKKPIPMTGSSTVTVSDPELQKFQAALRKQLINVATTHPHPHTRALFRWMADGRKGPEPRREQYAVPTPEPISQASSAPVAKRIEPRRAPPVRPAFRPATHWQDEK